MPASSRRQPISAWSGGGRGDDGGVDLAGEVAGIGEGEGLVAGGGFGGAGGIGIDDGGELRAGGFVDHAAVVLSEGSGADDGYTGKWHRVTAGAMLFNAETQRRRDKRREHISEF